MEEGVRKTTTRYSGLVSELKGVLRISTDDELIQREIIALVEAAIVDLKTAGITNTDINDPLIKRAISVYCKAHFGYDNPDTNKLIEIYEALKCKLSLVGSYHV